MVAVVKWVGVGDFNAVSYLLAGAGTTQAGLSYSSSTTHGIVDVLAGSNFTSVINNTANPYMFAVSKGAGSVAPKLGWKLGSGGAWTHDTAGTALNDQSAANAIDVGVWQSTGDPANAWIGVVAWYEGAMSDVNKEALDDNWRTSDLWNSAHGTPTFLIECNVAAASVVDLAGNASVSSHVGTTLDAGETLNSWNFDGTGVAAAPPPLPLNVTKPNLIYLRKNR